MWLANIFWYYLCCKDVASSTEIGFWTIVAVLLLNVCMFMFLISPYVKSNIELFFEIKN